MENQTENIENPQPTKIASAVSHIAFLFIGIFLGAAVFNPQTLSRMGSTAHAGNKTDWATQSRQWADRDCAIPAHAKLSVCQAYRNGEASANDVEECFISTPMLAYALEGHWNLFEEIGMNSFCPVSNAPDTQALTQIQSDCQGIWDQEVAPNYCANLLLAQLQ
jgi:hypothetical protein